MAGMVQFSLRRLLASITLFAAGSAIVVAASRDWPPWNSFARVLIWIVAGSSFGAAVLIPFKLGRTGAVFGALFGIWWALGPDHFRALE
jgi:hypothetical protein